MQSDSSSTFRRHAQPISSGSACFTVVYGYLYGLLLDSEDGDSTLLRNVRLLVLGYTTLPSRTLNCAPTQRRGPRSAFLVYFPGTVMPLNPPAFRHHQTSPWLILTPETYIFADRDVFTALHTTHEASVITISIPVATEHVVAISTPGVLYVWRASLHNPKLG